MKLKINGKLNTIIVISVLILTITVIILLMYDFNLKKEFNLNKKIEDWKQDLIVLQNYVDVKKINNELNNLKQFEGISDMKTEKPFVPEVAYKLNIKADELNNRVSQEFIDLCAITSKGNVVYFKGITFDKYTIYYSPGYIFKITELSGLLSSESENDIRDGNLEY